jgi:metal-responsive CopG/Arc/MetJ family transcriptional regulator
MKTAVSIPDEVFEGAERLAKRSRKSRSQIYSDALREYVARHSPDEVTEALDRALEQVAASEQEREAAAEAEGLKRFRKSALRAGLKRSEWN